MNDLRKSRAEVGLSLNNFDDLKLLDILNDFGLKNLFTQENGNLEKSPTKKVMPKLPPIKPPDTILPLLSEFKGFK